MNTYRMIAVLMMVMVLLVNAAQAQLPWNRGQEIPGLDSNAGTVGAAWQDGILHVVALTSHDGLLHTRLENGSWVPPTKAVCTDCGMTPALASDGATLHLICEATGRNIQHAVWDGRAWSNGVKLPDVGTNKALGMAAADGVVHLVHCGRNSDAKRLYYVSNAGWGWSGNQEIADQNSTVSPGLAVLDGELHAVHSAASSKTLWHSSRNRWGTWSPKVQVPGAVSSRRPSLVTANGKLYLFFAQGEVRMGEQAPVAYCVLEDGSWSAPVVIEGYVVYGEPVATVQPGLPEQIHLLLPAPAAVQHLATNLEVKLAPMKLQQRQLKH